MERVDLLNPIVAALTNVAVGLETSFNRLSVVPLIARVPSAPQRYITLDEALARGDFEVTEISEGGQVPQLHVLNTGMHPVLLVDGEELIGAKQNRIINLTILVPAMEKLSIPVTCVEAGRWNRRSRGFASSGNAQYSRARANKVVQVSQSLAETGEARSDQHWIWDDIAAKADRMNVNSSTSAMSNIFDARQPSIDEYVKAFAPVDGQCGAVFLLEGIPVGLDFFESEAAFRKLMPKLLRSHALDALDEGEVHAPKHVGVANPRDAASAFLARAANAAKNHTRTFPTVGLGEAIRFNDRGVAAAALLVHGAVVHLAAFDLAA